MFDRITVRAVPAEVANALAVLAAQHDRSLEAEARFALRSWAEPILRRDERSARLVEVSGRLRELLDKVNEACVYAVRPSHIASGIGEERAGPVEQWFTGELEPTFGQLAAVADYLGGGVAWLQHGDGQPFPVGHDVRVPENPGEGVKWLLDFEDDTPKVDHLHLIRSGDKFGKLAIVKQYRPHHCKTYSTPYHVSEEIGGGGESSLAWLSLILNLLYKYYVDEGRPMLSCRRCPLGLVISSYILPESEFSALLSGRVHPVVALRGGDKRPWWEDFWDPGQFRKDRGVIHWPSWHALCERIYKVVEHSPACREALEQINSGKHPLLCDRA